MRLFERQTYDFHWWTLIWGKRIYPLTRAVYFLECPLIRDFTTFVSFPFSHAWAGHQCSFSRTTSLPVFVVPKTVFSSDMVDSDWNRTGGILHYFAYQRVKLFAGNKINTQFHYIYKIFNTRLRLRNHSEMSSRKYWELVRLSF